jgi:hypothetical protein
MMIELGGEIGRPQAARARVFVYAESVDPAIAARPWKREYWLGSVDPRPLALMRICLGFVVISDLVTRLVEVRMFLTDASILPRGTQTERWAWSAFDLVGSTGAVSALLVVALVIAVAFTLGYRTRLATVLLWLVMMSVQNRNLSIGDGGDDAVRVALGWSMFTDLGGAWSLDVRFGRRPYARVFALGARMIQWQLAVCYFGAGYLKARGTWLGGDALYQTMQLTKFARPLGDAMLAHPGLCKLFTFASLATELALPILILSWWQARRARGLAVLASTMLQIGIMLMMRVGLFTAGMLVIALALVPPSWFDRIEPTPAQTDPPLFGRLAAPIAVVLVFHLFLVMCSELLPSCPAIIETELQYIGLNQGVDLFTRPIPIASWHAEGTLADGTKLDIIPIVAPELEPPVGWWFSRWHKFTFKGHIHFPELGAYMCRRYTEVASGPKLVGFTLARDVTMPHRPGETSDPPRHEVLLEQSCN